MELFVITVIAGIILLIITINNDIRRQAAYREQMKTHKGMIACLERYRWLYEMGYRETACSFNMIG